MNDGEELWTSAARLLREQVSDVVWLSTFQDVRADGLDDDGLHLVLPSPTVREHITSRYLPLIEAALIEAGADRRQPGPARHATRTRARDPVRHRS